MPPPLRFPLPLPADPYSPRETETGNAPAPSISVTATPSASVLALRMIDAGTDGAAGFWETRNQVIVKRCMRKAMASRSRRVLFVFGAEHKYAIEKYLRRFYHLDPQAVVRMASHGSGSVSAAVLARWRRNRDSLARVVEGKTLPEPLAKQFGAAYLKRLEEAIEAHGRPH